MALRPCSWCSGGLLRGEEDSGCLWAGGLCWGCERAGGENEGDWRGTVALSCPTILGCCPIRVCPVLRAYLNCLRRTYRRIIIILLTGKCQTRVLGITRAKVLGTWAWLRSEADFERDHDMPSESCRQSWYLSPCPACLDGVVLTSSRIRDEIP